MTVISHTPNFSVFLIEDKTERPPCWERCIHAEENYFKDQMAAPVPEIMDGFLYVLVVYDIR
jgi:hypothetical protein